MRHHILALASTIISTMGSLTYFLYSSLFLKFLSLDVFSNSS